MKKRDGPGIMAQVRRFRNVRRSFGCGNVNDGRP